MGFGGKQSQPVQPPQQQMPSFEMPHFEMGESSSSSSAEYAAQQAEAEEQRKRDAGLKSRDGMYADRMSAAGSATDEVNAQIAKERANAAMMNLDYEMTSELKAERINNQFASMWGEGDEDELGRLMTEWGNPEGHEDFSITRGDASAVNAGTEGGETSVGESGGLAPSARAKTVLEEDEELGGGVSVLGV